jgi:anti-sigma factor RsiW
MSHLDDKLAAYVDGELGHEARERVLAHLAECAECREEAEEQRRIKQLLGRVQQPGPSGDLMARLLALGDPDQDQPPPPAAGERFTFPTAGRPAGATRSRARATGPRAGRPGNMPERVRPPVNRRRLTFAAAGAFSMMAVALSSAFVPGGTSDGNEGRPAAPAVERYLTEQAATTTPLPAGMAPRRPTLVLAGTPLLVAAEQVDSRF